MKDVARIIWYLLLIVLVFGIIGAWFSIFVALPAAYAAGYAPLSLAQWLGAAFACLAGTIFLSAIIQAFQK